MCGIFGKISKKPITNLHQCVDSLNKLSHRGPDDSGTWISERSNVFLGHRRLSIIDLSDNAKQPMHDNSSRFVIVFNGEIYNFIELKKTLLEKGYLFKNHSDTEVILNSYTEWGSSCLKYLNGMFSFAIFDKAKNQLFMARDRAGEKPLYYSFINATLVFSSELKGLFYYSPLKRKINRFSFDNYLAWGYVSSDKSIIEGVNKLKAAHTLTFDLKTAKIKENNYWNLPSYSNSIKFNYKELV